MPPPPKPHTLSPSAFAITQLSLLATEQAAEVAETTLLLSDSPPTVLARAGLAILNLNVVSQRTGLGGRTVVELGLDSAVVGDSKGELPEHGIRTGDIVRVGEQPKGGSKKKELGEMKGKGVEGVVTRVGERAVWVAMGKEDDGEGELGDGRLWLRVLSFGSVVWWMVSESGEVERYTNCMWCRVKLANDVTFKRYDSFFTPHSGCQCADYRRMAE